MEKEGTVSTGCGAVNREVVLEKMLAEEVAKRDDAERAAEELRKQVQLLKAGALDLRQARDLTKGSVLPPAAGHEGTALSNVRDAECAESRESALKAENHRLRQLVKRQNALIDVLRRQKVLLEASAAINISVRDFDKQLEIHKFKVRKVRRLLPRRRTERKAKERKKKHKMNDASAREFSDEDKCGQGHAKGKSCYEWRERSWAFVFKASRIDDGDRLSGSQLTLSKMTCVTGDDTGVVKIWDISKSSGATLKFSFGEQSRKRAIMGMCWQDSSTSSVAFSSSNGVLSVLDINDYIVSSSVKANTVAGLPNAMSFVKGKLVVVSKDGEASIFSSDLTLSSSFLGNGPIDALHIHRKFGMVAMGGRENDLCVYDLASEALEKPVFQARNVRDHILDVPFPVFVTGACIVNPYVFATCTAYHQVRFYDRRSNDRPVQEFEISREIERRPTTMLQWNANKFLIGEASGDVHLYDTRRGFCSRAKLRGGVGSVRCMCKHPAGHQILGVTGLDRKARLYHVPTGKLLMSVYVKQKANCVLLDKQLPLRDRVAAFSGVVNTKQPEKANTLGDALWDDMDPVLDELDEKAMVADTVTENRRKVQRRE